MNKKTINRILKKKFDDWTSSIKNENVKKLVEKNTIISGGAIVSLLQNEKPNDYDVYFKNKETVLAVAKYYCTEFNNNNKTSVATIQEIDDNIKVYIRSNGVAIDSELENLENLIPLELEMSMLKEGLIDIVESADELSESLLQNKDDKEKYRPVYLTSNAITLSNKIQLVIRFYGTPEKIHNNFDFIHTKNYWESDTEKLYLNPDALECILNKELKYTGSLYPIASIIRTRKFMKRGWNINAGQYLKMCFQVSNLDLTNISILEDQLTGVDQSYFRKLIEQLQEQQDKNPEFTYGAEYITTIIDRLF